MIFKKKTYTYWVLFETKGMKHWRARRVKKREVDFFDWVITVQKEIEKEFGDACLINCGKELN